jgi:hypothetical protein
MVLAMVVAMVEERTRCCLGSRVKEYRSCLAVAMAMAMVMAMAMLGERNLYCLGSQVGEYCSCAAGCTPVGPCVSFSP